MKRFIVFVLLFLLIATPAFAVYKVYKTDRLPFTIGNPHHTASIKKPSEVANSIKAVREYVYIVGQLPALHKYTFVKIYIVPKRYYFDGIGLVAGFTTENSVVLPAYERRADDEYKIMAHELGHFYRFKFIPYAKLSEYYKKRTKTKLPNYYYQDPEELFAEDFMYLFGSLKAREGGYFSGIEPPSESDKNWILRVSYKKPKN